VSNSQEASLEIYVSPQAGFSDAGGSVGAKAKEAFDALGTLLTDAIEPFRQKIATATASADEIEVKLDLALKGSGKWVVVSVEGGATVSVKLVWKKKS
jgi:Trypsin-co-occurring domain 1